MKILKSSLITAGVLASCLTLGAQTSVNAATLEGTFPGNDCDGVYGTSPNCTAPGGSPLIYKFDVDNNEETFGNFPTIDGTEFNVNNGSWTYTPGPGDPIITNFVVKAGPNFNLYKTEGADLGDPQSDNFSTPGGQDLSHITFYDTVPEPMTILGSVAALGFGTVLKRQKNKKMSNQ
jgi:hypothetical protein